MKWYRQSFDYVLYEMSYENIVLYGATIPSFDNDKKEGDTKDETLSADNPDDYKKIREFYRKNRRK